MIVLVMLAVVFVWASFAKADVYEGFVKGAGEGLRTAFSIIPYLAAALLMTGMLRASGMLELLSRAAEPIFDWIQLPKELLTLMLVRPLSGAAALSELDTLISLYGPDSYLVRAACCIIGSSEPVLYLCALYLGSIKVKYSANILPIGLITGVIAAILGAYLCKFL